MKANPKFLVIRVYLLIQIVAGGFIAVFFLGMSLYDGFSKGFQPGMAMIPVKRTLLESELSHVNTSLLDWVKLNGQLETESSWISGFILPFFNSSVYEISFVYAVFSLSIYLLLYLVLINITKDNFFPKKNILKIYAIGALMIIWPIIHLFRNRWMQGLVDTIDSRYMVDADPQGYYFNLGIIILIIGSMYKTASELQTDKELTI